MEVNDLRKYAAELIGTFVLVFMGCGSAVLAGKYIGNVGISFSFGLAVLAMAYAIGGISASDDLQLQPASCSFSGTRTRDSRSIL
jgi:glycerol uptake facilitator-like aquaporin